MTAQDQVTRPEANESATRYLSKESRYSMSTDASISEYIPAFSEDYPLVNVARETMAILSPEGRTLFTAWYAPPPGGATFIVKRGKIDGLQIGSATTHLFSTEKVDVQVNGEKLRFKETFESLTGLGHLTWSPDVDSLFLEDSDKTLLACFIPKETDGKSANRPEGRFEIRKQGLGAAQFDEIVVTGLAELERRRKKPGLDGAILESVAVSNGYTMGGGCCVM